MLILMILIFYHLTLETFFLMKLFRMWLLYRFFFSLNAIELKIRTNSGIFFPFICVLFYFLVCYTVFFLLLHFLTFILFQLGFLVQIHGIFLYIVKDFIIILPDWGDTTVFVSFHFVWSSFIIPDEALIILHVGEQEFILLLF